MRTKPLWWVVLGSSVVATLVLVLVLVQRRLGSGHAEARCSDGFAANGARCLPIAERCPSPLAAIGGEGARGCEAPETRVLVPATALTLGPSDWEAEGRVAPRSLSVAAFEIDAFELTVGKVDANARTDVARAASALTYEDAERLCRSRGGRLPTEDEWIAAAAGERASRYPWGDTGAVCRRAAWGLASGPCASSGTGPDTVGAHPSGSTPRGVHDLAGNVAEWVASPTAAVAAVRGGSWRTALAPELRTWARREIAKTTRADDVGARCAYDLATR